MLEANPYAGGHGRPKADLGGAPRERYHEDHGGDQLEGSDVLRHATWWAFGRLVDQRGSLRDVARAARDRAKPAVTCSARAIQARPGGGTRTRPRGSRAGDGP